MLLTTATLVPLGILLGIIISAPVGPVNVLCIQRTLHKGFWGGIATGLGAVIGDGILAAAAAFGIKAISGLFKTHELQIEIIGGIILLAFAAKLFFTKPVMAVEPEHKSALRSNTSIIPQTFFLTVTNPGAFLGIFTLFTWVKSSVGSFTDYFSAAILVLSVMGGGVIWWCCLAWLISTIRHKLNEDWLRLINRAAAATLIVFGLLLFAQVSAVY